MVCVSIRANVACENSRPSSLPSRVAFREKTPLGPGAKKDGCFLTVSFTFEDSRVPNKAKIVKKIHILRFYNLWAFELDDI